MNSFAELFAAGDKLRAERKAQAGVHRCVFRRIGTFGKVDGKAEMVFRECIHCGEVKS